MKFLIESVDNGFILREIKPEYEDENYRPQVRVIEEDAFGNMAESKAAQSLLWQIMELLGLQNLDEGNSLRIIPVNRDGDELDERGKKIKGQK